MFKATTRGVIITVMPVYIDERSDPANSQYFWAYRVMIDNQSDQSLKLLTRYWKITDGNGLVEEVQGEGVVGEQPLLESGESFNYTSGCPLTTSTGFMEGYYIMQNFDGETLEVAIPAFSLDLPDFSPVIN